MRLPYWSSRTNPRCAKSPSLISGALGYQLVQAASGRTALRLTGGGSEIDLLITDYAMAEMNGIEFSEAARVRRPDLPIVIMTGYSDVSAIDAQMQNSLPLKKPCRLADLAAAVERALAS